MVFYMNQQFSVEAEMFLEANDKQNRLHKMYFLN